MRKRSIFIALGALLLTAACCAVFVLRPWDRDVPVVIVSRLGDAIITLEVGQSYTDPGAGAVYERGEDKLELTVETLGQVDTQKTGSYLVKYTATHKDVTGVAYRQVNVVDTVAPKLSLVADPDLVITEEKPYIEEGYTAVDDYDGDITDRVYCYRTKEKIFYVVADQAGNTTTAERWIAPADTRAPEMVLIGGSEYSVPAGLDYADPGWTVRDNRDGDISDRVVMTGTVDIRTPGTYTLTYTVSDEAANTVTLTRNVTVVPQTAPEMIIPEQKTIYLTFDDGPGPYTEELLDILKKYDVKATFFVVNSGYIHLVERMVKEGHAVGVHTTTHKFKDIYASDEAFLNDLFGMRKIIQSYTGEVTTLMRFPGGSSNTVSRRYSRGIMTRMTEKVVELGFQYFDWNVDSDDAGGAEDALMVYNNVISGVEGRQAAVVLQHDVKDYSVEAVERIIRWGLDNGYTFAALTPNSPGCHHGINN